MSLTVGVARYQALQRNALNVATNLVSATVDELRFAARLLVDQFLFAIEADWLLAGPVRGHPGDDHFGCIGCLGEEQALRSKELLKFQIESFKLKA